MFVNASGSPAVLNGFLSIEISKYFQAAVWQDGNKIKADKEKTKDRRSKSSKESVQCLKLWKRSSIVEDGHHKKTSSTGPMNFWTRKSPNCLFRNDELWLNSLIGSFTSGLKHVSWRCSVRCVNPKIHLRNHLGSLFIWAWLWLIALVADQESFECWSGSIWSHKAFLSLKFLNFILLLMAEILHHLGCMKPYK